MENAGSTHGLIFFFIQSILTANILIRPELIPGVVLPICLSTYLTSTHPPFLCISGVYLSTYLSLSLLPTCPVSPVISLPLALQTPKFNTFGQRGRYWHRGQHCTPGGPQRCLENCWYLNRQLPLFILTEHPVLTPSVPVTFFIGHLETMWRRRGFPRSVFL